MKKLNSFILTILCVFFVVITLNAQSKKENKIDIKKSDPWTVKQVITTSELEHQLKEKKSKKPIVLQIGFDFLFNQGHIPESKFIGAALNQKGIDALKNYVKGLNKNTQIVIYCGCCPMDHCPNVQPAFKTLEKMGYKNTKVLYLPDDFGQDWVDKGYPVAK
ncbi:MAG TPA: rhodanese-like domain-containing protein [Ignavibacteriaceae bacterium]|nr:rhodanese-like domain-containing protein [Ignavibacteriaceae bacterium]